MEQELKPSSSTADLLRNYQIDTRSVRERFIDEAVKRVNAERKGTKYDPITKRTAAIMINFVCPKKGGDAWVHDYQKACQTSKTGYSRAFFGIYKKRKKIWG